MPKDILKEKALVEKYLKKHEHSLAAFSFVNIFIWQDYFAFDVRELDGNLCVVAKNIVGEFLYLPPLGNSISPKAVEVSFERMRKNNKNSGVSRIENFADTTLFDVNQYKIYKKSEDYIYLSSDIADLKGNAYKSKRSSCNQFVKNNNYELASYEDSMRGECLALYQKWARGRKSSYSDGVYQQMIDENEKVHSLVFDYHQELNMFSRVVLIAGRIEGYTFGYEINKDMFCILLEVTNLKINGLATFIFSSTCQLLGKKYKYINAMDDFGMDNIKKVKMSFHPVKLLPAYNMTESKC